MRTNADYQTAKMDIILFEEDAWVFTGSTDMSIKSARIEQAIAEAEAAYEAYQ